MVPQAHSTKSPSKPTCRDLPQPTPRWETGWSVGTVSWAEYTYHPGHRVDKESRPKAATGKPLSTPQGTGQPHTTESPAPNVNQLEVGDPELEQRSLPEGPQSLPQRMS